MGDMADLLMDQMDAMEGGCETFEERLEELPPHLWLANSGEHYVIAKMEARHVANTVRMLGRWVDAGRGDSEADIVGKRRWENLLKRLKETGGRR